LTNIANVMLVFYTWYDRSTTLFGGADKAESAVYSAMCSRLAGTTSVS